MEDIRVNSIHKVTTKNFTTITLLLEAHDC